MVKKLKRKIKNLSELMDNLNQVDNYLFDSNDESYQSMVSLIGNGTNFVVYQCGSTWHFAPSRFVGYLNNTLLVHLVKDNGKDGKQTSPEIDKIIGKKRCFDSNLEEKYLAFCHKIGATPKRMIKAQRKYWLLSKSTNDLYNKSYNEGRVHQVWMNKYERSNIARKKCIEKYGCKCFVCGMDFEKTYGELGKGFIHVHHIVPLSNIGKSYQVDYEKDLIPVCPNCHAMLHKGINGKVLTIDELKEIIRENK